MPTLFLVRHAQAAPPGGEGERPITARGESEARGLVGLLAGAPLTRIVSSPLLRCRQTVAPLAGARGLAVETDDALAEGRGVAGLLRHAEALRHPAAICSHGDVIPDVLDCWRASGLDVPPDLPCETASVWAVEIDSGAAVTACYLASRRDGP